MLGVECLVFYPDGVYLLRAWGWGHAPAGSWTVGYWLMTGPVGDEGESTVSHLSLWSCAG